MGSNKRLSMDNTIEFLKGRLYLGAFDFTPKDTQEASFFTMDDELFYNNFHLDFGPFHVAHLYRFALRLHEELTKSNNVDRAVVFYSSTSTKKRANAACLLCCYMVLIQSWTPHQVLQPLAQVDPPFMPFRDAGYSVADFEITIQDVVYGCWKAKEHKLLDLHKLDLDQYEYFEKVDNGDLNILSPHFIAFASPRDDDPMGLYALGEDSNLKINKTFRKVIDIFKKTNTRLVVRLNSHLYNKAHFEKNGIRHLDMIFEDGTCPDLSFVLNFIGCVETIINEYDDLDEQKPKIAVHCKAGLGRTGCLIGAYLIYKHDFTANECIGFLRLIRPGMVVGPQQHWLYINQHVFRDWKYTKKLSLEPSDLINGMYPLVDLEEVKAQKKRLLQQKHAEKQLAQNQMITDISDGSYIDENENGQGSPINNAHLTHGVPLRSPGQPRKNTNGVNTVEKYDAKQALKARQQEQKMLGSPQRSPKPRNLSNSNSTKENRHITDDEMRMIYNAKQQQQQRRNLSSNGINNSSHSLSTTSNSNNNQTSTGYPQSVINHRNVSNGSVRKVSGNGFRKA
ncbi:cell division control protein 14 [Hanseniaspora valbyensis]